MSYIIALAGKGGTGKTTVASLLIKLMQEQKLGSILAVDADPNSNLAEALGCKVKKSIGEILDEIGANPDKIPKGMSKDRFIEYEVQMSVSEGHGFDLLTMGRPEGPGCYCYVNNVLRNIIGKLINDYDFTVIDNEAGLEHLSRRTTRSANALLVVSDATSVGLRSASRIKELAMELKIKTEKNLLLINRYNHRVDNQAIKGTGLEYIGNLPHDENIMQLSIDGSPLLELNKDTVSLKTLRELTDKIF